MSNAYNLSNVEPLFKNSLLAENISAVTLKNYLSDLRHFLGWLAVYRAANTIESPWLFDNKSVDEYIEYLKNTHVPDKTLNRRLSTLRKFCTFCFESQLIERNYLQRESNHPSNISLLKTEPQVNLIKLCFSYLSGVSVKVGPYIKQSAFLRVVFLLLFILILSSYLTFQTFNRKSVRSAPLTNNSTGRILTFQGNLTDKLGNPVDSKTDVVFRLYTKEQGGTPMYVGKCVGQSALTPDLHGLFSATIGKDCGMKQIPPDTFIDNPNIYLGITVGSDPEMQPRQQIANVGTAAKAQSLGGLELGTGINNVPFVDNQGVISLTTASPMIESTSGTFTLKGKTLTLATSEGGDINLNASAGGNVFINGGNVGIGTSVPPSFKLELTGNLGPSIGYTYDIGSPTKQWANLYAEKLYQNSYEVCDTSGNCSSANGWNVVGSNIFLNTALVNPRTSTDEAVFDAKNVRLGIGTANPTTKVHINGSTTGKALAIFNETGDQNIIVASASGTTKFIITHDGHLGLGQERVGDNRQIDTASGAYLTTSGVWTDASSRDWKDNFTDLDYENILDKVKGLSISEWNYKSDVSDIKHIGPVAEDFYNSFGLGSDNKHIATLDTAGVALAAIKGLSQEYERNYSDLQGSISDISQRINNIENTNGQYVYNGILQSLDGVTNDKFITIANNFVESLKNSLLTVKDVVVENSIAAKNITSETLSALNGQIDELTTNLITVREKISSPVIETKDIIASGEAKIAKIKTNQISSQSDNLTIDLNNRAANDYTNKATNVENKGALAQLIIKGLEGKVVASIDEIGNATFSGNLEANSLRTDDINTNSINAQTATIEGSLVAKTIKSDNIDALSNSLISTQNTISTQETDLQELTSNVNDVQRILADLQNQPINTANYQNLMQELTLSLNNVVNNNDPKSLNSTDVTNNSTNVQDLTILGSANIYKAGISDSLTVGDVFIRDNSLLSLSWDLNISALSSVNFFGGMVALHKDGNLVTNGQVIALGGVQTNNISSVGDGNDINIQLKPTSDSTADPKVAVRNGQNQEVASIDTQGDAYFNSLKLEKYQPGNNSIITASENLNKNGEFAPALDTNSYSAGEGLLPADNSELIIYNDRVKAGSLIYLTSTSSDASVHLSVTEQQTCSQLKNSCRPYFKVGSDKTSHTPITFNWLLVN